MAAGKSSTFYIDIGWRRAWVLVLPVLVVLFLAWPRYTAALAVAAQMSLFAAILVFFGTVSVRERGIVLYRVNYLVWSNIKTVTERSILGLPYVHITKIKGFTSWWLPLYLRNASEFYASVVAHAPIDNPLRRYAETVYTQQSAPGDVGASAPPPLS